MAQAPDRRRFTFDSKFTLGKEFYWEIETQALEQAIKNEPCFYRATTAFARRHGGDITRMFIDQSGFDGGIFDSRAHMLMPNMWPCIPGWHHDDVPRTRDDGQPNYRNPAYRAHHCMGLVNAHIAPTEFLIGQVKLDEVLAGEGNVYERWDALITGDLPRKPRSEAKFTSEARQQISDNATVKNVPGNQCIFFNADDFHRGVQAVQPGFRWFGRVTINTHVKPVNEFRNQTNVYLEKPTAGW